MKRWAIIVMALSLSLVLAGAAFAAGPKKVCFQYGAFTDVVHLIFKSMGTVKTSAGTVKIYAVHGEHHAGALYSFPVTGTAHVSGTTVHWNTSGTYMLGGELYTYVEECTWDMSDLVNPVGTSNYRFISDAVGGNASVALNAVDCEGSAIPYAAEDLGPMLPIK
jgi:hypothetical protein